LLLQGDLVLPMVSTNMGQLVRSAVDWEVRGGSMRVEMRGQALLHAMLFADAGSPSPPYQ